MLFRRAIDQARVLQLLAIKGAVLLCPTSLLYKPNNGMENHEYKNIVTIFWKTGQ
jgi:hypothetical protein